MRIDIHLNNSITITIFTLVEPKTGRAWHQTGFPSGPLCNIFADHPYRELWTIKTINVLSPPSPPRRTDIRAPGFQQITPLVQTSEPSLPERHGLPSLRPCRIALASPHLTRADRL
ncbi:hypothetical protein N7512_010583 [Penicillium capsulatum]|nr:hypothetical protein N7512_010583 [Penicillium capsulatum]